jgi:hypothetical protein
MTYEQLLKKYQVELNSHRGQKTFVEGTSGCKNWEQRIKMVKASPDNKLIPKHELSGQIIDGYFYLHNGVKIEQGSYYGYAMLKMLVDNNGVHEPEEEKAFGEILPYIKDGSTMIELGAYWAHYSMWFNKEVKGAKNIMVEPTKSNLEFGKKNFELNGMQGTFYHKKIGAGANSVTVDQLFELENIDRLAICHSDIQGFEFEMLKGAKKNLDKIDYFFISTHGDPVHNKCYHFLKQNGFIILCSSNKKQTYSWDGLIVARNPKADGPDKIEISHR